MTAFFLSRRLVVLIYGGVMALACMAVWMVGYQSAVSQLETRGRADLALATARLTGELQRYRSLAVLTGDRPEIFDALQSPATAGDIAGLLREMADKTGTLDMIVVDRAGREVVATTDTPASNHATRPYFERTLDGALGVYHLFDPRYDRRVFYYAAPVFAADGPVIGAVIVVVDVGVVESAWRGDELAVFFTDDLARL